MRGRQSAGKDIWYVGGRRKKEEEEGKKDKGYL